MFFLYLKITKCEKYKKIYKKVAKTTQKKLAKRGKNIGYTSVFKYERRSKIILNKALSNETLAKSVK